MKKYLIASVLAALILFGSSLISYAHAADIDFYEIFEEHNTIMLLVDLRTGKIEHANKAAADFYGYSIEELESMYIYQINTGNSDTIQKDMQSAASNKNSYFVFEHKLANGEIRTVEVYSCPHRHGDKTLLFSIIHDITDKTLLEQKNRELYISVFLILALGVIILTLLSTLLIKNNKKLKLKNDELENLIELRRTFIDADKSLIYLKDEELRYIFANKAVVQFYNKKESEIIGHELTDAEFADMRRNTDLEVMEKQTIIEDEVRWENRIYRTTKFPVKLMNGKYGVGAYITDVTEEYNNKRLLERTIDALTENEEKLKMILDSAGEAIYGIDLNGNCTFCNPSCLKMLGYKHQDELIGKNMHWLIHHSRNDGTPLPMEECNIFKAFIKGEGTHVDNEVLWRADGTCFEVEYFSYPQFKNGAITGAVVTFIDITSRKRTEREVIYLSYHDSLTGLYNRRFFEEELNRLDTERNLPVSIIMGDLNGLKLINDIFGHAAGDMLLKKAAEVMKRCCRADDIIARWGGDEFIILLPDTESSEAEKIAERIKQQFSQEKINSLSCNISLGYDTKNNQNDNIDRTVENAENNMYKQKTFERKKYNGTAIKEIISTFHEKHPGEKEHSVNVSRICREIGLALNLSEDELKRAEDSGFFHDIGKVILEKNIIEKSGNLTDSEIFQMKQHPETGYRILNACDDTMILAKYVLCHHERWDGNGYPNGLRDREIPMLARIISLADSYDIMTRGSDTGKAMSGEDAILEIERNAGTQFDPELAEIFIKVIRERDTHV